MDHDKEAQADDEAVDRFAAAMKAKMSRSRAKGRGGWQDPNLCDPALLLDLFAGHLDKGNENNEIDLACLLMMLRERGVSAEQIRDHLRIS